MGKVELGKGDPIEVRFASDWAGEAWRPGTVEYADADQVVARFDDGSRYTVNRKNKPARIRPRLAEV